MRSRRVQYRAVVRFSIFDPDWTGWRATNSGTFTSPEDYRRYLWSTERLDLRFDIFGRLAAPIYQRIAERHDFRVLVQHSPDLPGLDRLADLARTFPVIVPMAVSGAVDARETVRESLAKDGRTGDVVMLRVDDDDLISVDFLDQLQVHVIPVHRGWCVSLGKGLAARPGGAGLTDFRLLHSPLIAIGQAYLGHYRRRGQHLDLSALLSHRTVPETLPTIVDSRSVAYIHVRHEQQDTRVGASADKVSGGIVRSMAKLPKFTDVSELEAKFPTLTAPDRATREV